MLVIYFNNLIHFLAFKIIFCICQNISWIQILFKLALLNNIQSFFSLKLYIEIILFLNFDIFYQNVSISINVIFLKMWHSYELYLQNSL